MSKFVSVDNLGMRKRHFQVPGQVVNPTTGTKQLGLINKVENIAQPLLTAEEALVLEEADWIDAPEGSPTGYPFMCMAGGRRFFAQAIPNSKEPIPEAPVVTMTAKDKSAITRAVAKLEQGKELTPAEMTAVTTFKPELLVVGDETDG